MKKYKGVPSTGIPYKDFSRIEKLKKKLSGKTGKAARPAKGFPKTTATGKKFEEFAQEIEEAKVSAGQVMSSGKENAKRMRARAKAQGRSVPSQKNPYLTGKKFKVTKGKGYVKHTPIKDEVEIEEDLGLGKVHLPDQRTVMAINRKIKADAPEVLKDYRKLLKKLDSSFSSGKEIVYYREVSSEKYRKKTGITGSHRIVMRDRTKSPLGKEVVYHKGTNDTTYETVLAFKEEYIPETAKAKEILAILKKFPAEAKRVKGGDSLGDKKNTRLLDALDTYFNKKEPKRYAQHQMKGGDSYNYLEDAIDDVYSGDFVSYESYDVDEGGMSGKYAKDVSMYQKAKPRKNTGKKIIGKKKDVNEVSFKGTAKIGNEWEGGPHPIRDKSGKEGVYIYSTTKTSAGYEWKVQKVAYGQKEHPVVDSGTVKTRAQAMAAAKKAKKKYSNK